MDNEEISSVCYLKLVIGNYNHKYAVIREPLKFKISLKSCHNYLMLHYPDNLFTNEQIYKCYTLFSLVIKKANFSDAMNDDNIHIGHTKCSKEYGVMAGISKDKINKLLFFHHDLFIICYNINSSSEVNTSYVYTIISLLNDGSKYQSFLKFWSAIVDHEQVRDCLKEKKLTDDVIDLIFSFV